MKIDMRKFDVHRQREKRAQALEMKKQGHTYRVISEAVGVHPRTVAHWVGKAKTEGIQKTIEGGVRGRRQGDKRIISVNKENEIRDQILKNLPDQLQLPGFLWTSNAIENLIAIYHHVTLPKRTLSEYLRRWGYQVAHPKEWFQPEIPEEINVWLNGKYGEIIHRCKKEQGRIFWGQQTSQPANVTGKHFSFASDGQSIEMIRQTNSFPIDMLSAISNRGKIRFMLYQERLSAALLITFLSRLCQELQQQKVFLILKDLRIDYSKKVDVWLDKHHEQIEVFFLPTDKISAN